MKTQRGFTFVELMIAMTIALVVMATVSMIMVDSGSAYRLTEGLNRTQENGRFAMFFITEDIRKARQMGCSPTTIVNHLNSPADYYVAGQNVVGYTYTGSGNSPSDWTPTLPAVFSTGDVVPDTDVIAITRAGDSSIVITPPYMTTPAGALHVEPGSDLDQGDIVLITDCINAELFQITAPSDPGANGTIVHSTGGGHTPGNATKPFSKIYGTGSMIISLMTKYYYIGTGAGGAPALFVLGGNSVLADAELVGYINDLDAEYGQDTDSDGSVDLYSFADSVADWSQVNTVRVSVVARTPEKVSVTHDYRTQTYQTTVFIRPYRKVLP